MIIYEILKELLKVILVDQIRSFPEVENCCCRRRNKPKKIMHSVGMDAKLHKKKGCKGLRTTKREVKKLTLCEHCAECETEQEA